jgi:hypothetical protein
MGSELSCPCGERQDIHVEESKVKHVDIVEELLKGKLTEDDIFFQFVYGGSKICIIRNDQFEAFFTNRNFLKLSSKQEINYYYNLVYLTNSVFSFDKNYVLIFMQFTPGLEDKSVRNSSYINSQRTNNRKAKMDYKTYYKIEIINLVSNEPNKVMEQLLNDLNNNLKKDFLFYGVINDIEEIDINPIANFNTKKNYESVSNKRSYKILYKKSLLKENINCKYSIESYEGFLDRDLLSEILSSEKNSKKILKAIIVDSSKNDFNYYSNGQTPGAPKNYYFIFEENLEFENNLVYLVIEMTQGNTPDKIFLQDITIKLNDYQNEYKLCCLLNEEKKFYVIFAADSETLGGETPYESEF